VGWCPREGQDQGTSADLAVAYCHVGPDRLLAIGALFFHGKARSETRCYNSYIMFDPVSIIAVLIALVLALTLHEFAHALMGHYLGDSTAHDQGRLTLNPLAHIDPVMTILMPLLSYVALGIPFGAAKPVPFNPWAVRGGRWGAAMVALAGPLTNLLLALFFALWLRFIPVGFLGYQILGTMILTNVSLFVFNMIPFPPIDGSRVLYAIAPAPVRDVMDRIEGLGVAAILIFFLGIYYLHIGDYVARVVIAIVKLIAPVGPLP